MVYDFIKKTLIIAAGVTGAVLIQGCVDEFTRNYSRHVHPQHTVESKVNTPETQRAKIRVKNPDGSYSTDVKELGPNNSENYITKIREIGPDGRVYTSIKEFDSKRNLVREYKE
jgi:hypothetical protein